MNMNKLIAAVVIAFGLAFAASTPAAAQNCRGLDATACAAAQTAAARAPYQGPLAPTTVPMACVRVVSYAHTEVVWIHGNSSNFRTAPIIQWQGRESGYTETFSLNQNWIVTESCIERWRLEGVNSLVLCMGTPGTAGYHWALTDAELWQLKRTGHFTSYVPFLEVSDRESLSVPDVTRAYRVRYGV